MIQDRAAAQAGSPSVRTYREFVKAQHVVHPDLVNAAGKQVWPLRAVEPMSGRDTSIALQVSCCAVCSWRIMRCKQCCMECACDLQEHGGVRQLLQALALPVCG